MRAQARNRHLKITTLASLAVLGTVVLAGCGGSSTTSTTATQGHLTPLQSNPDVGPAAGSASGATQEADRAAGRPHQARPHTYAQTSGSGAGATSAPGSAPAPGHSSAPRVQKGRGTPASADEHSPTGNGLRNPCRLVSVSEARSIVGGSIAGQTEAPLGPTCIYKAGASKANVTLTVESLNFAQVTHQMAKRQRVSIAGRSGYCGTLGKQMLFIPLPGGQILNITAPCAVAERFASIAVGRIAA